MQHFMFYHFKVFVVGPLADGASVVSQRFIYYITQPYCQLDWLQQAPKRFKKADIFQSNVRLTHQGNDEENIHSDVTG